MSWSTPLAPACLQQLSSCNQLATRTAPPAESGLRGPARELAPGSVVDEPKARLSLSGQHGLARAPLYRSACPGPDRAEQVSPSYSGHKLEGKGVAIRLNAAPKTPWPAICADQALKEASALWT